MIAGTGRRTIEYHFAEMLREFGVSSRSQAIAWLAQGEPGRLPSPGRDELRAAN